MTPPRWVAAFALAAVTPFAAAQETTVGVSADVSILLGLGLSVGIPVGDRFNIRGVYHGFSISETFDDSEEKLEYDAKIKLSSFAIKGDWHPFRGAFRLTTGLMANGNRFDLAARDDGGEFEIGDCRYRSNPSDPLNVDGRIDWRSTAPYLGIGWGGNLNAKPGFYGVFDLGVMFSGAPKAALTAAGSAIASSGDGFCQAGAFTVGDNSAQDNQFRQELRQAEDDANDEAKDFKLWPNLAFGIGWRF